MLLQGQAIATADFEAGTGWSIKPEGACRGEVCVPLGDAAPRDGMLVAAAVAAKLGMPLVERGDGLAALGPATLSGHALATAEAPELVLEDFNGDEFRLSSLRGQKVVLVAWAPY